MGDYLTGYILYGLDYLHLATLRGLAPIWVRRAKVKFATFAAGIAGRDKEQARGHEGGLTRKRNTTEQRSKPQVPVFPFGSIHIDADSISLNCDCRLQSLEVTQGFEQRRGDLSSLVVNADCPVKSGTALYIR